MSNRLIKNRFTFGTYFQRCGLNKKHNMLKRIECECGCGGYAQLAVEDIEDIYDFSSEILGENDCGYCAIFFIDCENNITVMIRDDDNDEITPYGQAFEVYKIGEGTKDYHYVGELFSDMGLHCFGLMYESESGMWDVADCQEVRWVFI